VKELAQYFDRDEELVSQVVVDAVDLEGYDVLLDEEKEQAA
jgi:hypothetical protein